LLLDTTYVDNGSTGSGGNRSEAGETGKNKVILNGIDRDSKRYGVGPDSLLDTICTLEFLTTDPDFTIDSFFDVFYEIDFHPPDPASEYNVDSFFDITYRLESERMHIDSFFDVFYSHTNRGNDFTVDSFFDVFYELDLPSTKDSFFDVFTEVDYGLPSPGRIKGDFPAESFFDVFYEIDFGGPVRMPTGTADTKGTFTSELSGGPAEEGKYTTLGMGDLRARVSGLPPRPFSLLSTAQGGIMEKDSFFDVFTELSFGQPSLGRPGGNLHIDSFFDVFTELYFKPVSPVIQKNGPVFVDSFFDVFTEVNVDGQDWDLVAINDQDWDITAEDDWESPNVLTSSFFDVFTTLQPDRFAETLPDDWIAYNVDSFFDVFFEISMDEPTKDPQTTDKFSLDIEAGTEALASIFREIDGMSATIEVLEYQEGGVNDKTHKIQGSTRHSNIVLRKGVTSCIRILDELNNVLDGQVERSLSNIQIAGEENLDGKGDDGINWYIDSFFDVFFELEVERPTGTEGVIETELVALSLKSDSGIKVTTSDSFFDVFTSINFSLLSSSLKDDCFTVDSFFDSIYEVEPGSGPGGSIFHVDSFFDVFFDLNTVVFDDESQIKDTDIKINRLAHIDGEQHRPPTCIFSWGQGLKFKGILTDITERYRMFEPDGAPVRAELNANFFEYTSDEEQIQRWKSHRESGVSRPDSKVDSFFDVFVETKTLFPTGPAKVESFFDVFTELSVDVSGSNANIDSFFDVFTELSVDSFFDVFVESIPGSDSCQYHVDSFFDVFTELSVDTTTDSFFDVFTEMSVDSFFDVFVEIDTSTSGALYNVDSFFDVFTELSVDSGGKDPYIDSFFDVFTEYSVDSFFDVFVEIEDSGGPGGMYNADSFFDVFTELSGDLSPDSFFDVFTELSVDSFFDVFVEIDDGHGPGGQYNIDSFFDVFTELSVDSKGSEKNPDSFFDVFTELSVDSFFDAIYGVEPGSGPGGKVFHVDSFFDVFTELSLANPPDSFFDVFTELSVDSFFDVFVETSTADGTGGKASADSFFDVFSKLSHDNNDWDITGGLDFGLGVTSEDDWEAPNVQLDSFFDVFTELSIDSFFDVFAEKDPSTGKGDEYRIDSFFDVFTEMSVDSFFDVFVERDPTTGKGGLYHIDSFFDVFTELTFNGRGIDLNEDDNINVELRTGSFFDVFAETEPLFPTGPAKIESFFDVFTELSFDVEGSKDNTDSFFEVFTGGADRTISAASYDFGADRTISAASYDFGADRTISAASYDFGGDRTISAASYDFGADRTLSAASYDFGADRTLSAASYDFAMDMKNDKDSPKLIVDPSVSLSVKSRGKIDDLGNPMGVEPSPFIVDSFFDVFVELDVDNDVLKLEASSFEDGGVTSEDYWETPVAFTDSFFDVFVEVDLPGLYSGGTVATEIVSMSLKSENSIDVTTLWDSSGDDFAVDSFFDVFFDLDVGDNLLNLNAHLKEDGGVTSEDDWEAPVALTDSFFDVIYEVDPGSGPGGTVATEIVSMSLRSETGLAVSSRDPNTGDPEEVFHIDSFFDVFTSFKSVSDQSYYLPSIDDDAQESVNSLNTDKNTGSGIKLEKAYLQKSKTESSVEVMFNPAKLSIKKTIPWKAQNKPGKDHPQFEWTSGRAMRMNLSKINDSFGNVVRGLDSFFESSNNINLGGGGQYHIDSFFDVFTELSVDESGNVMGTEPSPFHIESFFDVYIDTSGHELGVGQSPFHVDSFFDVFFDITVTDVDPQRATGTVATEMVSMSLSGMFQTEIVSMDLSGGGEFAVDSFFDVFYELEGTVEGDINENYEVSFDGSIELKNDVEKQFGESVKVGIAAGARLTVKVTNNAFKGAELTGVVINTSVELDAVEIELEGNVEGSINESYEVSFDGSIELKNDVEKQFGESVKVGIASGARLERKTGGNFTTDSFFDVFTELTLKPGSEVSGVEPSPFRLDLFINVREEHKIIVPGSDVSGVEPSPFHIDSFFDVYIENIFSPGGWGITSEVEADIHSYIKGIGESPFHADSFFDVYVENIFSPGGWGITSEVEADIHSYIKGIGESPFYPDSFFDVFSSGLSVQARSVFGVDRVSNPDPTTGGSENETDEELATRVSLSLRNHFRIPGLNDTGGTKLYSNPGLHYGLISELEAVVIIGAVSTLGTNLETTFNTVGIGSYGDEDDDNNSFELFTRLNLTLIDNDKDRNETGKGMNSPGNSIRTGFMNTIGDSYTNSGSNRTKDNSSLTIPAFDKFHVLTRASYSRSWSDRNGSGTDSFFDVFVESRGEYSTAGMSGGGTRTSGSSYSGAGVMTLRLSCSREFRDNDCNINSLLEFYSSTAFKYCEIENESDDEGAKMEYVCQYEVNDYSFLSASLGRQTGLVLNDSGSSKALTISSKVQVNINTYIMGIGESPFHVDNFYDVYIDTSGHELGVGQSPFYSKINFSAKSKIKLFTSPGIPVRAKVSISLVEQISTRNQTDQKRYTGSGSDNEDASEPTPNLANLDSSSQSNLGTRNNTDTPGTGYVFMTNFFNCELVVADLVAGQSNLTAPVGSMPMDVKYSQSTNVKLGNAYVPNLDKQLVEVSLDLTTSTPSMSVATQIDLSGAPITGISLIGSIIDPLLGYAYYPTQVSLDFTSKISYVPGIISTPDVNLSQNQAVDSYMDVDIGISTILNVISNPNLNSFLQSTFRGIGPVASAVTDSGDVFTTNVLTSNVSWLHEGTMQQPIPVGDFPIGIASDDQYVYVTCLFSDKLYVIDQETGELVKTLPVGAVPIGVKVDEARNLVYVANFLSGDISVIDSNTLQPTHYSPLSATNLGTLMTSLGLSSSNLQSMFNQFFAGLGGGSSNPLSGLLNLLNTSSGTGGLQSILSSFLNQLLGSLGINTTGGSIPFVGIQSTTSVSIVDNPATGTPGGIASIGSSIGNFGPNAFDFWSSASVNNSGTGRSDNANRTIPSGQRYSVRKDLTVEIYNQGGSRSITVGEKVMVQHPTYYFPSGGGQYAVPGSEATAGPNTTFQLATKVNMDLSNGNSTIDRISIAAHNRITIGSWSRVSNGTWGSRITSESWSRITAGGWDRVSNGTWDRITVESWSRVSGGAWDRISNGSWGRVTAESWSRITTGGWDRVSGGAWNIDSSFDVAVQTHQPGDLAVLTGVKLHIDTSDSDDRERECPQCGAAVGPDDKTCPECGNELNTGNDDNGGSIDIRSSIATDISLELGNGDDDEVDREKMSCSLKTTINLLEGDGYSSSVSTDLGVEYTAADSGDDEEERIYVHVDNSLKLERRGDDNTTDPDLGGGLFHIDSFFDVTYEIEPEDDGDKKECPNCGASVDPDDKTCPECGEELDQRERKYIRMNATMHLGVRDDDDDEERTFISSTALYVDASDDEDDDRKFISINNSVRYICRRADSSESGQTVETEIVSMTLSSSIQTEIVSIPHKGTGIVQTEIVSMTLSSSIQTEIVSIPHKGTGIVQTEIVSMELSGIFSPGGWGYSTAPSFDIQVAIGCTLTDDADRHLRDKFFDVFVEIDLHPPEPGSEFPAESFFDVFVEIYVILPQGIINQDPEKLGRCKIHLPWLHEPGDETHWARLVAVMGGKNLGNWTLPEVDDEVLVAFEHGDPRFPYLIGVLYDGKDEPPEFGAEVETSLENWTEINRINITSEKDETDEETKSFNISYKAEIQPDDIPGLDNYTVSLDIFELKAGAEPKCNIKVDYGTSENAQFSAEVAKNVKVQTSDDLSETRMTFTITTYELYVNPETGQKEKKVAFIHVIEVVLKTSTKSSPDQSSSDKEKTVLKVNVKLKEAV
jgi:phage tail-like protein